MTVFLTPKETNLRNVLGILSDFYRLSGLKVSVSKTSAIWFGSAHDSTIKLCPDLSLNWSNTFTLLGIKFDSNLEHMQDNFDMKIKNIDKLLSGWLYRHLTPFGKVTVIKSLALSKLSHVALVVPNPTQVMLKKLESILFTFLWSRKSEKVSRKDAMLPVQFGGLGMPHISKF